MIYLLTRGAFFQYCSERAPLLSWCRCPLPILERTLDEPPEHQKCRQCAREMAWAAANRPVTIDLKRKVVA